MLYISMRRIKANLYYIAMKELMCRNRAKHKSISVIFMLPQAAEY